MGIFDDATREVADRMHSNRAETSPPTGATSVSLDGRAAETIVAGETVPVADPETEQTSEGTWLTGAQQYGIPRGREALEARQIQQTWPMELIANGIVDQLTGGDLAFESDGDDVDGAEADLQALLRDVITGPHLMDDDLDDLIAAAVADMLGPGHAYWHLLGSEDGTIPVVSMVPLDALTIRHNSDRHGVPQEPPYYQAMGAFSSTGVGSLNSLSPTALQTGDLAVMRYPGGRRSYQLYPISPAMQVRDTLKLLANSTTHHNRFYDDNEIPAGFIQVMNASSSTISDLEDKIQAAAGDPRSVEVIGGEGAAQWIEMGGTAINLSVIEEQQWFLQLCLAAVGLGKAEIGMIEDVNRANGEIEQSRVFKRVTGPFSQQFNNAFQHIAEQFDVYRELGTPFTPTLRFTDPREERAREKRLREMYQAGGLTLRQYARRRGDEDVADDEMTVEIGGEEIDYGDLPLPILEHKLRDARTAVAEDEAEALAEDLPSDGDDNGGSEP